MQVSHWPYCVILFFCGNGLAVLFILLVVKFTDFNNV
jgi:hypothetical protein